MAVTGTVMPSPYQTVLDANGQPVSGALVWTYLAGTSTPQATYTDATLITANSNPLVADSAGRFVAFLAPGSSYKFVYETAAVPPAHGSVLETVDLVSAIPSSAGNVDITGVAGEALPAGAGVYLSDGTGGLTAGRWYKAYSAVPYQSVAANTVGIVLAAVAAGASATVRTQGTVTGLTVVAGATYYVGDPPGTMTVTPPVPPAYTRVVGVADSTTSLVLSGIAPVTPPPAVIDTQTGTGIWHPPIAGNTTIVWNGTVDSTFDGIAAPAYLPIGTTVRMINGSATAIVYFRHQVPGASVRLSNLVTSGPTPVAPGGTITYQIDPLIGLWRMIDHEQGAAITPAFSAATYASSSGAWTVAAGNVATHQYVLRGRQFFLTIVISGSTISGTPGQLYINVPYQFSRNSYVANFYVDGSGGYKSALVQTIASQAKVAVQTQSVTNFVDTTGAIVYATVPGIDVS